MLGQYGTMNKCNPRQVFSALQSKTLSEFLMQKTFYFLEINFDLKKFYKLLLGLAKVWICLLRHYSRVNRVLGKVWSMHRANSHLSNWFGKFCTCPNLQGNTMHYRNISVYIQFPEIHLDLLSNFSQQIHWFPKLENKNRINSRLMFASITELAVV